MSNEEVRAAAGNLERTKYTACSYHPLDRCCIHFADELCRACLGISIPVSLRRQHILAHAIICLLQQDPVICAPELLTKSSSQSRSAVPQQVSTSQDRDFYTCSAHSALHDQTDQFAGLQMTQSVCIPVAGSQSGTQDNFDIQAWSCCKAHSRQSKECELSQKPSP